MTWDGVPLAIGGGDLPADQRPVVQADTFRVLGYMAARNEGVVTGGDCAVLPLAVPAAAVQVMPGAVGVLNRGADPVDGGQQMYVCRNPEAETVALTATSSGAGRTDLVAVIVEDPQYPGQPVPVSTSTGPYVRTVVYQGVPAATVSLAEVDPGQAGYALARVTRPASTGTVLASHITDLRAVPNARTRGLTRIVNLGAQADTNLSGTDWRDFPNAASWLIDVPEWATQVTLELYAAGVRVTNDNSSGGSWTGRARVALGGIIGADTELNPGIPNAKSDTFAYVTGGDYPVPQNMRGKKATLKSQARRVDSASGVRVAEGFGTTIIVKATFTESAAVDYWEV